MKKSFIFILLLLVFLLFSCFYTDYFLQRIYVKNFEEYTETQVFKKFINKKIELCYGNRFNCKKIDYKIKGNVNTEKIGTYKITYVTNYNNIRFSKDMEVKVVDKEKPKLTVEGSFLNVCPNGKTDNVKIEAIDNYDGNITNKVKYKVKDGRIIYKVSDSSGNTTRKEFKVNIMDNKGPTIILNEENTLYISVGEEFTDPGYVAIDDCDGNITENVKVTGKVNTKKKGTYELKYSVSDESGNETIVNRIVKVFPKNNYQPGVVSNKTIYLTFDDGPGAHTARLLDILKKYNVKATFFVVGYNNNYNDLITREYNEGHTLGLHSYTHNYGLIYSSIDSYMEDLLNIQNKVKEYTKVESKIIRFPGGSSNTISRRFRTKIMSDLTKKVEEIGFRYFDWTIMSGDAGNTKDPNKIFYNVTSALKEDGLNVVLMHDIKPYTVDSIERIIEYGLSNGYTFAPLTMDSPVVHQKVNN